MNVYMAADIITRYYLIIIKSLLETIILSIELVFLMTKLVSLNCLEILHSIFHMKISNPLI
jgi:hypothetical protein